jgi:hypothetical protein
VGKPFNAKADVFLLNLFNGRGSLRIMLPFVVEVVLDFRSTTNSPMGVRGH